MNIPTRQDAWNRLQAVSPWVVARAATDSHGPLWRLAWADYNAGNYSCCVAMTNAIANNEHRLRRKGL